MKHVNRLLKPLSDVPLQAYLDNRLQLFDVLEFILLQTSGKSLCIHFLYFRRVFAQVVLATQTDADYQIHIVGGSEGSPKNRESVHLHEQCFR